jgi:hypothetical protein
VAWVSVLVVGWWVGVSDGCCINVRYLFLHTELVVSSPTNKSFCRENILSKRARI